VHVCTAHTLCTVHHRKDRSIFGLGLHQTASAPDGVQGWMTLRIFVSLVGTVLTVKRVPCIQVRKHMLYGVLYIQLRRELE
jgi:hypothetical protein